MIQSPAHVADPPSAVRINHAQDPSKSGLRRYEKHTPPRTGGSSAKEPRCVLCKFARLRLRWKRKVSLRAATPGTQLCPYTPNVMGDGEALTIRTECTTLVQSSPGLVELHGGLKFIADLPTCQPERCDLKSPLDGRIHLRAPRLPAASSDGPAASSFVAA